MKIERLRAEHYDRLIGLMNEVFGRKRGCVMNFEVELPNMCVRDDAHMGKHFGIFDGDALVAALGVYPLPTLVGGEPLLFATAGNVVTHPAYEGRGYMSALLERAMRELDELGVDVARLGGYRARYNRYGFESCGTAYTLTLTEKNRAYHLAGRGEGVTLRPLSGTEDGALAFCASLYNRGGIAVTRSGEAIYRTMTAWGGAPLLAERDGTPIGYAVIGRDGTLLEQQATDVEALLDLLVAVGRTRGGDVVLSLPPYATDALRRLLPICESCHLGSPSHFFVRHIERTVGALLRLKASLTPLPHGELVLGVEGYGTLRLFVGEAGVGCERTEKGPELTLDRLSLSRYLFGPYAPELTAEAPPLARAWLPLPLGWCGQDRV